MIQPPPMPVNQQTLADDSHMQTLSVLHYILCGFGLLGIVFLIIHFAFMATFFNMASKTPSPKKTPTIIVKQHSSTESQMTEQAGAPLDTIGTTAATLTPSTTTPTPPASTPAPFPEEALWVATAFYIFFGLLIVAFSAGNVLSGLWIKKRNNRTFSFVVAAMNCIQFPFGTALGIFTFIVLSRPSVETAYVANRRI